MRHGIADRFRATVRDPRLWVAAFWVLEIYAFQASTLGYDYTAPLARRAASAGWRLMLDVLALGACTLVLPRLMLIPLWAAGAFVAQTAWVYHGTFGRALSWSTLAAQTSEGVQGAGFDWAYLTNGSAAFLLTMLGIKVGIVVRSWRSWPVVRKLGIYMAAAYLAIALIGVSLYDPLNKLRRFGTVDRMGATHGYILTWLGEAHFLAPEALLAEALERAQQSDTVMEQTYGPLPVSDATHVVIVQVESLDWRALGHQWQGGPLLPFLSQLRNKSMVFRAAAVHQNGSADADFIWLTGKLPSPRIITYKLRDYPYSDSLADKAVAAGYEPTFVHGNSGEFFDRRKAINQMHFEHIWFSEELFAQGLTESIWGLDDDVVLRHMASVLRGVTTPQLMYLVTLTSHQPFSYLPPDKAYGPAEKSDINQRYWQSINYVDHSLQQFYDQLPDGTLLVIFGDHRAMVQYSPTDQAYAVEGEFVPLLIHQKGRDLGQVVAGTPDVHIHSAASWVHQWLGGR